MDEEVEIGLDSVPQYVAEPDKSNGINWAGERRNLSYEVSNRYYNGGYENYVREVDTNGNSYKYGAGHGDIYEISFKNGIEAKLNHRGEVTNVIGKDKDHETVYKYDRDGNVTSKDFIEYDMGSPKR